MSEGVKREREEVSEYVIFYFDMTLKLLTLFVEPNYEKRYSVLITCLQPCLKKVQKKKTMSMCLVHLFGKRSET